MNPVGDDAQRALRALAANLRTPRFRENVKRWREEIRAEEAAAAALTAERSSSLDHLGLSDPREKTRPSAPSDDAPPPADPPRALFLADGHELAEVERLTEAHRRTRASRHERAARLAARGLRDVGEPFAPVERDVIAPQRTPEERRAWPPSRRAAVLLPRQAAAVGRDLDERAELRAAAERTLRWHKGRQRGALERFERVATCGQRTVRVVCNACDRVHEVPDRCGCDRLCKSCRAASRKARVKRLAQAQLRVLEGALRAGLLNRRRRGGRWGERLITLTVPHFTHVLAWNADETRHDRTVDARIDALFRAWRRFTLRLQAWAREASKHHRGRLPEWYRAFEWTPGHDGRGHPHFHVWAFSPWIPYGSDVDGQEGIRDWWRAALVAEGVEGAELAICDVRAAHGRDPRSNGVRAEVAKGCLPVVNPDGQRVQRYVEGWSIADARANGAQVSDEVLAALYEALDGRRLVATSPRLLTRRNRGCQDCGAVGWTRTEILDKPRELRAGACLPLEGPARSPP